MGPMDADLAGILSLITLLGSPFAIIGLFMLIPGVRNDPHRMSRRAEADRHKRERGY